MGKPRLLDLFARAQGTSVGYARAGFSVTASDIDPYSRHPEVDEFVTADALEILTDVSFCRGFDVIAASPPCKLYSSYAPLAHQHHPMLVGSVRESLVHIGVPFVIENVEGKKTRAEMVDPVMLCGSMFGLGARCRDGAWRQLRRHRLFDSSIPISTPGPCRHLSSAVNAHGGGSRNPTVSVVGHGGNKANLAFPNRGWQASKSEAAEAMGIDWMRRDDLSQAIPPVYTEHIGKQIMLALGHENGEKVG